MVRSFAWLSKLLLRLRYPVSLPEEIAMDIGISLSNFLTFDQFVHALAHMPSRPSRLRRFMPRDTAEAAFKSAKCAERFSRNSLFYYYFNEGWLEFSLHFDEQARLRRVYLKHRALYPEQGIEIPLNVETQLAPEQSRTGV